jgi:hypothetical protein
MAMVLTAQKPTQRDRDGEVSEGLPGSTLERGTCGEERQELGMPDEFLLERVGKPTETKSREVEDHRESDQLIVREA